MTIQPNQIASMSEDLKSIYTFVTTKYYEVENFALCILLAMLSKTNMIALGQPGIAKSAVLREIVDLIDFDDIEGTPYFHIQMGSDISPNNVFGAPDINFFKSQGIIKRHYKGFLPDAIIAFCSEFYRVSDQVANSGLLTILNEGEFKNGTDTVQTKLRFFMADTNFFPKQVDDLDVEESDLKLQALHDRFLARVLVKPISDPQHKIQMILMNDDLKSDTKLSIHDLIHIQDCIHEVAIGEDLARLMVFIASTLEEKHHIFISPRRLKLSRNLIRAHAIYKGRDHCQVEDLIALQFAFWQKEEDIITVKSLLYEVMDRPRKDAQRYLNLMDSILDELDRNIDNQRDLPHYDIDPLYHQALSDMMKCLEKMQNDYPKREKYVEINAAYERVERTYQRLSGERMAL